MCGEVREWLIRPEFAPEMPPLNVLTEWAGPAELTPDELPPLEKLPPELDELEPCEAAPELVCELAVPLWLLLELDCPPLELE